MTNHSMVAAHSKRPVVPDIIFGTSKEAEDAEVKFGKEAVINATIGALMNDEGELVFFNSVMQHIREMPDAKLAAYAPISGIPDYLESVKKACFMDYTPVGYIESVATPGGTGAIKHAVWNYTDMGDEILTANWYWAPYKTIAEEHGRKIKTFNFFNFETNSMDIPSFKEEVNNLLRIQDRLLIILNTPAHNPTGYSVSDAEWVELNQFLRERAAETGKKIILFIDAAYIDFAGTAEDTRRFFRNFDNLPDNLLVIVGYSMSKGYTLYGMRCGAIICVAANEEIAKEFKDVCSFSNRGAWSNGTRAAMHALADAYKDPAYLEAIQTEREFFRQLLDRRNNAFIESAKAVGLKTVPFTAGFFVSIPCDDPMAVAALLKKDNLFVIPLQNGLRFAPCAVSEEKCRKAPAMIKKYL
jgi:aromatic-amino-acid transaminase